MKPILLLCTLSNIVPKYIFLLLIQNKNLAISYINLLKSTFRIKTVQDLDCCCSLKTAPVLCAGGRHRVLSLRQPVHLCSRPHTETPPTHAPRGLCGPHTWSDRAEPLTEVSGSDTRGWGQGVSPHVGNGRSGRLPPPSQTQVLEDVCVLPVSWLLPTELRGSCELLGFNKSLNNQCSQRSNTNQWEYRIILQTIGCYLNILFHYLKGISPCLVDMFTSSTHWFTKFQEEIRPFS